MTKAHRFSDEIFSGEKRTFCGLERLRKSATTLSIADLPAELKAGLKSSPPKKAPTPASEKKTAISEKSSPAVEEDYGEKDREEDWPAIKNTEAGSKSTSTVPHCARFCSP